MRYSPTPMSTIRFRSGYDQIRYLSADAPPVKDSDLPQVQLAKATQVKAGSHVPLEDLPRLFHHIQSVEEQITRELLATGQVADADDFDMWIEVRARVKAWPAIPGITVPELDEGQR